MARRPYYSEVKPPQSYKVKKRHIRFSGFVLFHVPLALSIEIDAFVVQSEYIQLL